MTETISVAFVEATNDFGGSQRSTLELVQNLEKQPVLDVSYIVQRETPVWHEARKRNACNKLIGLGNGPFRSWNIIWVLKYSWDVFQILRKRKISIVHATNHTLQFWLVPAWLTRTKLIWNIRAQIESTRRGKLRRYIYLMFVKGVICVSRAVLLDLNHGPVPARCKVKVIPNFINVPPEERILRERRTTQPPNVIVGMIGRLDDPVKDVGRAMAIMQKVMQKKPGKFFFRLCGQVTDDLTKSLLNTVPNEHRSHIEIIGPTENVSEFYDSIDLLLLTSRAEGFPRVVLEASARSIPVIAHDVGGVAEAVVNGDTGFLFDTNEKAIGYLIKFLDDPSLRLKMGTKAFIFLKKKYTAAHVIPQYIKFYRGL